jgi:hypothetical protein
VSGISDIDHVEVMRLRPGDVIVATVARPITEVQAKVIAEQLRERFPGYEAVVVPGDITLSVARPEAQT